MDQFTSVVNNMDQYVKRDPANDESNIVPAPKRRKTNSSSDFRTGSIIRVKVRNFTTYAYAEFHLSPNLNMIIGPNGTGKSTLVAAICLGLAGKIDLIKRNDMKSMIKTGQDESSIEIELKNVEGQPNYKIGRQFTATKSFYFVNDHQSDEKKVRNICLSLSIQLDNLCHFLPQERVAEFAKLSPEKLLLEVQRTVGTGDLLIQHENLITIDHERTAIEVDIERHKKELETLLSKKEKLEEDVKKFEEYEKKAKDLESHKKLLPYAQLQDQRKQIAILKKAREEAKQRLTEFSDSSMPFENAIDKFTSNVNKLEKKRGNIADSHQRSKTEWSDVKEKINNYSDKIIEFIERKKLLIGRSEAKKIELEKAYRAKTEIERHLAEIPVPDKQRITELKEMRSAKHEQRREAETQLRDMKFHLTHQTSDISKGKSKVEFLRKSLNSKDKISNLDGRDNMSFVNCKKAALYLRGEERYRGRYLEPPIICVDVTNKAYARCLEKVVDNNSQLAFTAASKGDYDQISADVFDKNKINVPFRYNGNKDITPRYSKEELRSLGFGGYIVDFVTGPKEVIRMMCEQSNIHQIPVSLTPLDPRKLESLRTPGRDGNIRFMKLIAGDLMYQFSRSSYGNRQIMYKTEYLPRQAYLFGSSGMSEEKKQQIQNDIMQEEQKLSELETTLLDLQDRYNPKKREYDEIGREFESLTKEIKSMNESAVEYTKTKDRLGRFIESLKKLEEESQKDFTDEIIKFEGRITLAYKRKLENIAKSTEIVKKLTEITIELSKCDIGIINEKNKIRSVEILLNNLEAEKERLQNDYVRAKDRYMEAKNSDLSVTIREQTALYTTEEREHLGVLAAQYMAKDELTEDIMRSKINMIRSDLELSSTADRSSIHELKRHLLSIEQAETTIPVLEAKKQDMDSRIETIRSDWEPKLDALVDAISKKFAVKFTAVASAGEVQIKKAESFKDWRLEILVKFRDTSEFKVLDAQSQSGGERAVSTIFFMMCLQGLTDAPFRVVDEINQGMDPRNEKLAHKNLVHTACESSTSQYFLVTPKLLTGLYYHPKMRIHCIYTGLISPVVEDSVTPDFMDMSRSSY